MKTPDDNEVAFFGKITAAFTHELKNVLAIIRESSGLVEDIMSISKDRIKHADKVDTSLNNVRTQIERGVEMISRLNSFAHSTDHVTTSVDIFEITEQLLRLSERPARLQEVALKAHPPEEAASILTSPIRLQMALFNCIGCCLLALKNGKIDVFPRKRGDRNSIQFFCEGNLPSQKEFSQRILTSDKWKALENIVESLDGSCELDEPHYGILLFLPTKSI